VAHGADQLRSLERVIAGKFDFADFDLGPLDLENEMTPLLDAMRSYSE